MTYHVISTGSKISTSTDLHQDFIPIKSNSIEEEVSNQNFVKYKDDDDDNDQKRYVKNGNDNDNNADNPYPLPSWIKEYIKWHREVRAKYPGKELYENPSAPKLLVRVCLGVCGGLHDRIGQLPLDLYLANQTQRILLIKWQKPHPLQEFLIPPDKFGIDWRFPDGIEGWGTNCNSLNDCLRQVKKQPMLDGNVHNKNDKERKTFESMIETNIKILTEGEMKDTKAVAMTILGHLDEHYLEERLEAIGETDMIHHTPTFGHIFHTFFKPHPNIQKQIDSVSNKLGLDPGEYSVAHCRVRHPKAYPMGESFNGQFIANADKTGLPFTDRFLELSVGIASRSIQCVSSLSDVAKYPIYFMSDSSDLVQYIAHNLTDSNFVTAHPEWFQDQNGINATTRKLVTTYNVVAREQSIPNAHIDKNKGRKAHEYYAAFVDLYLGINAKCFSFDIGYYAAFAAKISGTNCKIRHHKAVWGEDDVTEMKASAPLCHL